MRSIPTLNLFRSAKNSGFQFYLFLLFSMCVLSVPLCAQATYTFLTAGATGSLGPTQAQLNTAYASTNLSGLVTSAAGIQTWTVPASGNYKIDIMGASGGSSTATPFNAGGTGARMVGEFNLNQNDVLRIVVGQKGITSTTGSGGGGTYVTKNNVLLIAAGAGGGGTSNQLGANGVTVTAGTNDNPGGPSAGGTNGNGGQTCASSVNSGGGGGGYLGNGANGTGNTAGNPNGGGLAFVNGSLGGYGDVQGGFGGGGGVSTINFGGGSGGGGYSGGAGGQQSGGCVTIINRSGGGGGGSYNTGNNQNNTPGVNGGDGIAIITSLCNVNLTASGSNSVSSVICAGQTITLTTNAISNFNWSTGNTTSSVITVSPGTTTTYSVSGTSALSCTSSAAITVTVSSAPPSLSVTSSAATVCLGNTLNINATGALNYTITNGTTAVPNNVAFIPATGINNYTVTGDNGCGTPPTSIVSVTVSVLPVTSSVTSTLVCSGTPATLTAGGATSYTWLPGASIQTNYVVSPTNGTTYTLTGKTGSCSGVTTITINTKANPTLNIVPSNTAICNGATVSLLVNGNATAYAWSSGQTATTISTTPTLLTLYTVTGIGSNNCVSSAQQVIIVNPNPTVTASASDPVVCAGGSSTLTATGAANYTWTSANTASVLVNPTANTTYTVTGSYSTGCSSTGTVAVSIFVPSLAVSGNTSTCVGTNVGISASGAGTYTWINTGAQSQGITVNPAANTIYTVTGAVNDPTSGITCNATNTLAVTVNPLPLIIVSSNRTGNTICVGESAVLTGSGAGATGTYTWVGGSGAAVSATSNVSPIVNQNYTVSGTDNNGCKGSANIQIIVAPCTDIPGVFANTTSLLIYPNPSSGAFNISASQAITLQIINELGQEVSTITLNGTSNSSTTVSNLAHGIYFIMGSNENGHVKEKIIIMK